MNAIKAPLKPLLCALPLMLPVAAHAELLFSEYVEGSSNNKAVEIYNPGTADVDLAAGNYKILEYYNGSATASGTIVLSGTVPAGGVFVVANSSASAGITGVANQLSGSLTFNGNDAVALTANGTAVDVIGQIGFNPGTEWGAGLTSTADNTLRRMDSITSGDPDGSDAFDPAVQWVGFATDTFDGLGCAGTAACGSGGQNDHRIYEIQGASHISPLNGQYVTNVPGIVTQLSSTGFYFQDPDGDGNPATSDAVFVYTGAVPAVTVGEQVTVNGTVNEYRPAGSANNLTTTEIGGATVTDATGQALFVNSSVTPTVIGVGGRVPPVQLIDSDSASNVESSSHVFDPAVNGIDFYESLEGMLVQLDGARVVGPTDAYGQIWMLTDGGSYATGLNARGGISLVDRGTEGVDYNPERVMVDVSGLTTSYPEVKVGDTATAPIVGVMSYDYSDFRIYPQTLPSFNDGGLQPQTTTLDFGAGRLSIAAYNVDNLDANDADICDGAPDQDVADGRFTRIAAHIVSNLQAPDILSIEEIQDSDGCTDDGVVDPTLTMTTLLQAIQDAGGPAYQYVQVDPVDDQDGGIPGGNIRQVILYNGARVSFVPGTAGAGDATTATAVQDDGGALSLTLSPGRIDPTNAAWAASRKPLAATFDFNGHRLLVISNHFDSKGGDDPLYGPVQPPVLSSATQRVQQAQIVHDFIAQALALEPDAAVVTLGDFNDFAFSQPMLTLTGEAAGSPILTDLGAALQAPEENYSYVYQGNSQEIDHIYVSGALVPGAEYQPVHVNAEFPAPVSDHDPMIATLALAAANQPPVADAGADQSVGRFAKVVLDGSASHDPDGTIAGYQWTQSGGPAVRLFGANAASPKFLATGKAGTVYSFTLTVTDDAGAQASDSVSITVAPRSAAAGWLDEAETRLLDLVGG